jgi:hypothetical protein
VALYVASRVAMRVALCVALTVALSVAMRVALSVALSVALTVALCVALCVAMRVALSVALCVALCVAMRVALSVALSSDPCFFSYQIAAEAPYANAITNGEGTITTRGFFKPAALYKPSIAGMIFPDSIGAVRIAREIQILVCASIRNFSSGVIPPVALVSVRTILLAIYWILILA